MHRTPTSYGTVTLTSTIVALNANGTGSDATADDTSTFTGAVGANFAGDSTYENTSNNGTLTVSPASATLSLGGLTTTYDAAPRAVTVATTPAGLSCMTVTYTQNGQSVIAPTTAGTCAVAATHKTPNYTAAPVQAILIIERATPTITWSNPADIAYGTALGAAQVEASASVRGAFAYSRVAGTDLPPGSEEPLAVTFTPADATDYETVALASFLCAHPVTTAPPSAGITPKDRRVVGDSYRAIRSFAGFVLCACVRSGQSAMERPRGRRQTGS